MEVQILTNDLSRLFEENRLRVVGIESNNELKSRLAESLDINTAQAKKIAELEERISQAKVLLNEWQGIWCDKQARFEPLDKRTSEWIDASPS